MKRIGRVRDYVFVAGVLSVVAVYALSMYLVQRWRERRPVPPE